MHQVKSTCDERLAVFKVVVKKRDGECLKTGLTITGELLQQQESLFFRKVFFSFFFGFGFVFVWAFFLLFPLGGGGGGPGGFEYPGGFV
jgi:hypothetical protein